MGENVKRILIIGAGAIGGTLGALLSRAGREVVFLTKSEETAAAINRDGMTVRGVRGTFTARPRAEWRPQGLEAPFALVMAAVKTYDLDAALRPALDLIAEGCPVVSLQNGICIEELERLVGRDRAVGCAVGWGATMRGAAEMDLTSEGELVIGCRSPAGQACLTDVAVLLTPAFPVKISQDILADLFSKLIINSCITTLGAISGRTLGWMLARRMYRSLFIDIIREGMSAARAAGIRVPPYAGRLDYEAFLKGDGPVDGLRRHLFIRLMGMKYRRLKSSSLQSLERGKPTEVDSFNGYIVRTARAHGLEAPLNERLVRMVHEIESKSRPITPANFLRQPQEGS
jgi:2-dehydropantoate 2-reductase